MDHRTIVLVSIVAIMFRVAADQDFGNGLSYQFYDKSCPNVEEIVRAGLRTIFLSDPTSPAALLRLMFHDCQVQGCDVSILVNPKEYDVATEMTSTKNFGIRKREVISIIKSMVEANCPRQVSCADIIILAARDAVFMSGGPYIEVPLGRRDSSTKPSYELADSMLPTATIAVDDMLHIFTMKGMTIDESVAILGAHTLGITHCATIQSRLQESTIEEAERIKPEFEAYLRLNCPQNASTNLNFVVNDPTSTIFDNRYFANIMRGYGVLSIDTNMVSEQKTAKIVKNFSADQDYFYQMFSSAFVKLSFAGVLTGNQGVIRKNCNEME